MLTNYTCITNDYDLLKEPEFEGQYLAYLDPLMEVSGWKTKQALTPFVDPTRNARMHKILAHQFVDSEWSLWMDGSIQLRISPKQIFEKYSKYDIVMFDSVERHCAYEEAEAVLNMSLDDPEIVRKQMTGYMLDNYPPKNGLTTTGCILRRHTPQVIEFNNYWWSELCTHSKRDQLSVDYVAWKLGLKIGHFEGYVWQSPDFMIKPHLKGHS